MSATYTFDIYSTLDGYGSYGPEGDWGGYWGKQGPEFLAHRLATYERGQRMVLGATTYREFVKMLDLSTLESGITDRWVSLLVGSPTTVVSSTLADAHEWPDATVVPGDGVAAVARLKEESDLPLRSHGSLSLNWALMAAGLVDELEVTVFPVISGRTGTAPIWGGAGDFDLELIEATTYDGRTQVLRYRPSVHGSAA
jgi:dihydrofolate reductase